MFCDFVLMRGRAPIPEIPQDSFLDSFLDSFSEASASLGRFLRDSLSTKKTRKENNNNNNKKENGQFVPRKKHDFMTSDPEIGNDFPPMAIQWHWT